MDIIPKKKKNWTYLTSVSDSSFAWVYKLFNLDNELSPGFSTISGAATTYNKRYKNQLQKKTELECQGRILDHIVVYCRRHWDGSGGIQLHGCQWQ